MASWRHPLPGARPEPPSVPFDCRLIRLARSMGLPPWVLEHPDRPPTESEASRWVTLVGIFDSMGLL